MPLKKLFAATFFVISTVAVTAQEGPVILPLAPAERDAHGCLTSAGSQWSVIKNSCVQLWKAGVKLYPVNYIGFVDYIIWSEDKKSVEVFIVRGEQFIMKMNAQGLYSYKTYKLTTENGIVLKNNDTLVASDKQPDPTTKRNPVQEHAPADGKLSVDLLNIIGNPGQVTFSQGDRTIFYYDQAAKTGVISLNGREYTLTNCKFTNKDSYTLSGNGVIISAPKCKYRKNKGEDCFYGSFAAVTIKAGKQTLTLKGVKVQDCPKY
jgi:hypothetical protein